MKRILLSLVVCALIGTSVQAAPSLGWWDTDDFGTTSQRWDFTPGYVNTIPGGIEAIPEELNNPIPGGVKMQITGGSWDGRTLITGDWLFIDIKIPNYPNRNAYKEIWVDLGLEHGEVIGASVVAGDGVFHYEALQPDVQSEADFGFRIRPNPDWESLQIVIRGGAVSAMLDYVRVDTICIPAPGALLLAGVGASLVGWLRRRKTL